MFRIAKLPDYWIEVKVSLPTDAGKKEAHVFEVKVKRFGQAAVEKFVRDSADGASDVDQAREIMLDWKGVQDDEGKDVPFSAAARDELLGIFPVAGSIVSAFIDSLRMPGKKLMAAAAEWARGDERGDIDEDLRAWGMDDSAAREALGLRRDACFVWPENQRSFELFLACGTLWRIDGFSGAWRGLDYSGVRALLELRGETDLRAVMDDLQAMERAVLRERNQRNG